MSKVILVLGFALLGQNVFAGALPSEWYVCKAEGTTESGSVLKFEGNGIHEVEASDNAMYFCRNDKRVSNCQVTSCTWQVVRPRGN